MLEPSAPPWRREGPCCDPGSSGSPLPCVELVGSLHSGSLNLKVGQSPVGGRFPRTSPGSKERDRLILWPFASSLVLGRSLSLWISWFCTPGASESAWHHSHVDRRSFGHPTPWEPERLFCHSCPSLVSKSSAPRGQETHLWSKFDTIGLI